MAECPLIDDVSPQVRIAILRFGRQAEELLTWVRELGGTEIAPVEISSSEILNDKGWSLVLKLGSFVLKVTARGMFSGGPQFFDLVGRAAPSLVPELIAWRTLPDGAQAMLFRLFGGTAIDRVPLPERPSALVSMVRSVGRIQAAVSQLSVDGLVTVRASDVPQMLDELMEGAIRRCHVDHAELWSTHCERQGVPEDFYLAAHRWRNAIAEWAEEIDEAALSIDHVDLLPHNAHLLPDGRCIVYDWEQATLGVPFFSLDVLLAYAQSIDRGHGGLVLEPEIPTATQLRMRSAYQEELAGPLELALRLAPIRYCFSEWNQALSAGVPHYAVDDVAWWLSRAQRRWERRP